MKCHVDSAHSDEALVSGSEADSVAFEQLYIQGAGWNSQDQCLTSSRYEHAEIKFQTFSYHV